MSRNNQSGRSVFRLSGNMALGGSVSNNMVPSQSNRPSYNEDTLAKAKNSLQLLKSKQNVTEAPISSISKMSNQGYGSGSQGYPLQNRPYDNSYSNYDNGNSYSKGKTDWQAPPKQPAQSTTTTSNVPRNRPPQPQQRDYNPAPQYQAPPVKEQPISELKKQQKVQVKEYAETDLIECSQGCGRRFNPESLAKHQNNCKKVFQQKRKQFNTQAQRLVAKEQVKLMKVGAVAEKKIEDAKKKQKIPKWKAESMAFRAGLAQSKGGHVSAEQQAAIKEAAGYIKCKFCGRSFNDKAAPRHIAFCEQQAKKNSMKNNAKPKR